HGSDFSLSATAPFALCHLTVQRSFTTPVRQDYGWVAIEVLDEHGQPTPARMGLYDSSGRLQLPSEEALILRSIFTGPGVARVIRLPEAHDGGGELPWPVKNRDVFYTDGHYHTR